MSKHKVKMFGGQDWMRLEKFMNGFLENKKVISMSQSCIPVLGLNSHITAIVAYEEG